MDSAGARQRGGHSIYGARPSGLIFAMEERTISSPPGYAGGYEAAATLSRERRRGLDLLLGGGRQFILIGNGAEYLNDTAGPTWSSGAVVAAGTDIPGRGHWQRSMGASEGTLHRLRDPNIPLTASKVDDRSR